jgi:DNA-binding response OmpR family regulator
MHVLLAIGDAHVRDTMHAVLTESGHDVTIAATPDEAIAVIDRDDPPFVVLGGDGIGGGSALDVCRHARARARDGGEPFVLVVTSDEEEGRLSAVLDAGADDFVLTVASVRSLRARLSARTTIAERRIAEDRARLRAEAALARTQRLLGVDEALAALQHEINNPLAALLAHAGLLEHGLHDPGEEKELLGVVVEQAHRVAEVVKRIAALRYPDASEYVPDPAGLLDAPDAAER